MNTLEYIVKKYNLDISDTSKPIKLSISRWHELGKLFNELKFKKAVEIGVYRGRFTERIARRAPNMEIVGVDSWEVYAGYKDYSKNDLENEAEKAARQRLVNFPNVKLIKGWSLDVANQFEDESLDWVFIDANHDYECVVADIAAWSPKVRKGGIVSGHDYFVQKKLNFGVIQAVDGWRSAYNTGPLFTLRDKCPTWMYIK